MRTLHAAMIALLAMLVMLGCMSRPERIARLASQHADWPEADCARLVDGSTWIGMSEDQLIWYIDSKKAIERAQALSASGNMYSRRTPPHFGVQESPRLRVYSIMNFGAGSSYRTWTIDKESGKVVDWYSSY